MKIRQTYAQKIILNRMSEKKKKIKFAFYADYIDEPYGDYYDTNSEEPH